MARLLLEEYDANPSIEDEDGNTPLMIAEKMGNEKIALLLSHYEAQQSMRGLFKRPREEQAGRPEAKRQKEALSNIN